MQFNIISIFPHIFDSYFNESILKRAQDKNLININVHNLRDWTTDKHHTVDDTPYGGGAGMVMKIEPLHSALKSIKSKILNPKAQTNLKLKNQKLNSKIILLSAKGEKWTQQIAKKYSKLDNLTMICGRYEGVDERITEFIDEEVSIGDYVLTGGEIGAMTIVDSVTRLIPDVLGNKTSVIEESHSIPGILEHPQYTKPDTFIANKKEYKVPEVLLSGHHKNIEKWKKKMSKKQKS